jgi:hypothetical protein
MLNLSLILWGTVTSLQSGYTLVGAMTFSIMTLSIKGLFLTLSISDAQHKRNSAYQKCQLFECLYAECRNLLIVVLSVIILSVVMLNVVMLNAIMLNAIMLNAIMLNAITLNVVMLSVIMLNVVILNVIMLNVVAPSGGLHPLLQIEVKGLSDGH